MIPDSGSKVAVVTGASRGIGKAVVRALAVAGYRVYCCSTTPERIQAAVEAMKADGLEVSGSAVDVADRKAVVDFVGDVVQKEERIDLLVNNAGIFKTTPLLDIPEDEWDRLFAVNVKGSLFFIQEVGRNMVEHGGGAIVNMASDAGKVGEPRQAVYAGAKGAIIAFTKSMAKEVGRYGVNVNAVCPSMTKTEAVRDMLSEEFEKKVVKAYPMRRLGEPQDMANMAVFLASERASWITGQAISVNGGYATT